MISLEKRGFALAAGSTETLAAKAENAERREGSPPGVLC
jgi:hypothetical protein